MANILITGGTGSFGQAMVKDLLKDPSWKRIVVYSRDEFKQHKMIQELGEFPIGKLRFFVGDVRDLRNLRRAMYGINVVIHAAALKQIPSCEYNPWESVKTNISGTWNVINAAIENGVSKVLFLSTDKAVNPINCYGATKLVAEKLIINSNILGRKITRFSLMRYGNVLASRGSVIQVFKEQAKNGSVKVTDKRMTRFWWELSEVVTFTKLALVEMKGGEIFIPKLWSSSIVKLAEYVAPGVQIEETGIRVGEKIHECLIAPDEVRRTYDKGWAYVVTPDNPFFEYSGFNLKSHALLSDFSYTSDNPDICVKEF